MNFQAKTGSKAQPHPAPYSNSGDAGRTRSSAYGFRNRPNALFTEKQLLEQSRNCLKFHNSLSNLLHDPRKKEVHKGSLTLFFSLLSLNHTDS